MFAEAKILDDKARVTGPIKKVLLDLGLAASSHGTLPQIGELFHKLRKNPERSPKVLLIDLSWQDVPFKDFGILGVPGKKIPKSPHEFGIALAREVISVDPVLRLIPLLFFSSVKDDPSDDLESLRGLNLKTAFLPRDRMQGSNGLREMKAELEALGVHCEDYALLELSSQAFQGGVEVVAEVLKINETIISRLLMQGLGDPKKVVGGDLVRDEPIRRLRVLMRLANLFVQFYGEDGISDRLSDPQISGNEVGLEALIVSGRWEEFEKAYLDLEGFLGG